MEDLLAARLQMAISLGFHIIFSSISIAMPFLMAAAHWGWLRGQDPIDKELTKAWSKGVAIFFATGAVSGTALSFELGLLWPGFMEHAGAIIGMPFSWEAAAFFLEAIALGIFLYGWDRLPPLLHWFSGLMVGVCGTVSAMFVLAANAWMNSPAGFDWVDGKAINIDPWAAMFNDRMLSMGIHMVIGAFQATGIAVAGLHAFFLLRRPSSRFHRRAFSFAMLMALTGSILQPISGHYMAGETARKQPLKLAAMEGLFKTQSYAPLVIGGIPDLEKQEVHWGIELPGMLSLLVHEDMSQPVLGLDHFDRSLWPPVVVVHIAFQIMVACGVMMTLVSLWWAYQRFRKENAFSKALLFAAVLVTPLGFIAIESGWTVTEVGRQPWIIYGVMLTKDAVSPMPGLVYPLTLFTGMYAVLLAVVSWLMVRQFRAIESRGL